MTKLSHTVFGDWAPIYLGLGLEPRPIIPGEKSCKEEGWNKPNAELLPGLLEKWLKDRAHYGIGLRMGTRLADGTCLGALDIDHDKYIRLGSALLGNPPCGRIGKKGIVYFFRYSPSDKPEKYKLRVKDREEYGLVAEIFIGGTQVVIPPTIHPDTEMPYTWQGTPLHEMDLLKLPYIGE